MACQRAASSRSPICLRYIKNAGITNTVWLTADVHYTAAHYYNPDKAQFQDFNPFWEFVSGPIHAGTFGPNDFDMTFGPELKFIKAPTAEQGQNLPPSAGLQFFGLVDISTALRAADGAADGSRRQRALQGDAGSGAVGVGWIGRRDSAPSVLRTSPPQGGDWSFGAPLAL